MHGEVQRLLDGFGSVPHNDKWQAAFADDGQLAGLKLGWPRTAGFRRICPFNDRAICHLDNARWRWQPALQNCVQHRVSRFGIRRAFFAETVLDDIARHLQLDPQAVRQIYDSAGRPRSVTHCRHAPALVASWPRAANIAWR